MTIRNYGLHALVFILTGLSLAACSSSRQQAGSKSHASRSIKLVYVEWSTCVASTQVARALLEKQGYKVQTMSVSAAAMFSAIANGDADATLCGWLPHIHASYYARTKDNLDKLGPNMTGTKIGLVVPDYVPINSISQIALHADKFQKRIVGIDPGAGEMALTQKVIKSYQLPVTLVSGSGATMTAALKSAIQSHQWIVVTGWKPHWMWARWKLKFLADPRGVYGPNDQIYTLVSKGFKKEMPGAWRLLNAFHWTPVDMGQVMILNKKPGSDAAANAKVWLKAHPKKVAAWLAAASATHVRRAH